MISRSPALTLSIFSTSSPLWNSSQKGWKLPARSIRLIDIKNIHTRTTVRLWTHNSTSLFSKAMELDRKWTRPVAHYWTKPANGSPTTILRPLCYWHWTNSQPEPPPIKIWENHSPALMCWSWRGIYGSQPSAKLFTLRLNTKTIQIMHNNAHKKAQQDDPQPLHSLFRVESTHDVPCMPTLNTEHALASNLCHLFAIAHFHRKVNWVGSCWRKQ